MNKWSPNTSILEIYTETQIHSLKVDLTRNFPYLEDFNYIYHPCNKYNHILNARQTNCIISQLPIGFKTSVLYSIRLINQPNSFIVEAGKKHNLFLIKSINVSKSPAKPVLQIDELLQKPTTQGPIVHQIHQCQQ